MNRKAFIRWQIKNFLPFFAILLAIVSSSFFSFAFATNVGYSPYLDPVTSTGGASNENIIVRVFDLMTSGAGMAGSFFSFAIVGFLYATVIPFVVYYYRYNKKASDAYGQFPAKRGEIIRIRVIIGQVMGLIILAGIFLLGSLIILLRQVIHNVVSGESFYFEYGYFFLFFLVYVITWSMVYYFNCFACSRAHCLKNAVITVAAYQVVVSLLLVAIYTYLTSLWTVLNRDSGLLYGPDWLLTFTPYFPTFYFGAIFSRLAYNGHTGDLSVLGSYQAIVSLLGSLLVTGGAAVGVFLDKEPSGETYGISKPRAIQDKIGLHLAGTVFVFFIAVISSGIGSFLSIFLIAMAVVMYAGVYLLLLFIYYKNLRLTKTDWIFYAVNVASALILAITMFFIFQNAFGTLHY